MKIIRKAFSKKEEEKESKLKLVDRINSAQYKLYKKGGKLEELEREKLNNTKKYKKSDIIGSTLGGAALGAISEMEYGPFADPVKGAVKGAALLGGAAALGHVGRDILEKKSPKYKKGWDKQKDLLDYRMGKLSKEEYIKRWGGTINGKEVEGSNNKEDK